MDRNELIKYILQGVLGGLAMVFVTAALMCL